MSYGVVLGSFWFETKGTSGKEPPTMKYLFLHLPFWWSRSMRVFSERQKAEVVKLSVWAG